MHTFLFVVVYSAQVEILRNKFTVFDWFKIVFFFITNLSPAIQSIIINIQRLKRTVSQYKIHHH